MLAILTDAVLAASTTTEGIAVHPSKSAVHGTVELFDSTGASLVLQKNDTVSIGVLYNKDDGFGIALQANKADSTPVNMFVMDPDAACDLYWGGVLEASTKSGGFLIDDELEIDGALNHDGSTVGLYGTTPAAQSAAYTRNATIVVDRTLLASASATIIKNNNVLAALIADLQSRGFIG